VPNYVYLSDAFAERGKQGKAVDADAASRTFHSYYAQKTMSPDSVDYVLVDDMGLWPFKTGADMSYQTGYGWTSEQWAAHKGGEDVPASSMVERLGGRIAGGALDQWTGKLGEVLGEQQEPVVYKPREDMGRVEKIAEDVAGLAGMGAAMAVIPGGPVAKGASKLARGARALQGLPAKFAMYGGAKAQDGEWSWKEAGKGALSGALVGRVLKSYPVVRNMTVRQIGKFGDKVGGPAGAAMKRIGSWADKWDKNIVRRTTDSGTIGAGFATAEAVSEGRAPTFEELITSYVTFAASHGLAEAGTGPLAKYAGKPFVEKAAPTRPPMAPVEQRQPVMEQFAAEELPAVRRRADISERMAKGEPEPWETPRVEAERKAEAETAGRARLAEQEAEWARYQEQMEAERARATADKTFREWAREQEDAKLTREAIGTAQQEDAAVTKDIQNRHGRRIADEIVHEQRSATMSEVLAKYRAKQAASVTEQSEAAESTRQAERDATVERYLDETGGESVPVRTPAPVEAPPKLAAAKPAPKAAPEGLTQVVGKMYSDKDGRLYEKVGEEYVPKGEQAQATGEVDYLPPSDTTLDFMGMGTAAKAVAGGAKRFAAAYDTEKARMDGGETPAARSPKEAPRDIREVASAARAEYLGDDAVNPQSGIANRFLRDVDAGKESVDVLVKDIADLAEASRIARKAKENDPLVSDAFREHVLSEEGFTQTKGGDEAVFDPTRLLQKIGGGERYNVVEREVLRTSQKWDEIEERVRDTFSEPVAEILDGARIKENSKESAAVGEILDVDIPYAQAKKSVGAVLANSKVQNALESRGIKDQARQSEIIGAAKSIREHLNSARERYNVVADALDLNRVEKVETYFPKIRKQTRFEKFRGKQYREDEWATQSVERVPPRGGAGARALPRGQKPIPSGKRDWDAWRVLRDYGNVLAQGTVSPIVIQSARAHARVLNESGQGGAADAMERWANASYGNTLSGFAKGLEEIPETNPVASFLMHRHRVNKNRLQRAVFGANLLWSLKTQPSSTVGTFAREGGKATAKAFALFRDPAFRATQEVSNYAIMRKQGQGGSIHQQGIGAGALEGGALAKRGFNEKSKRVESWLMRAVENEVSMFSAAAAHVHGRDVLGLEGRELQAYVSDGVAKVQSLYDYKNRPGILKSKNFNALIPWQSYSLEQLNQTLEVMGQTGAYKSTAPTKGMKLGYAMRALAGALAVNLVSETLFGSSPMKFGVEDFREAINKGDARKLRLTGVSILPLADLMGGGRGEMLPKRFNRDFVAALEKTVSGDDNWYKPLPAFLIRNQAPLGVQLSRTGKAAEAMFNDGWVTDSNGRRLYKLEGIDGFKATVFGTSSTDAARNYWSGNGDGNNKTSGSSGTVRTGTVRRGATRQGTTREGTTR